MKTKALAILLVSALILSAQWLDDGQDVVLRFGKRTDGGAVFAYWAEVHTNTFSRRYTLQVTTNNVDWIELPTTNACIPFRGGILLCWNQTSTDIEPTNQWAFYRLILK